MKYKIAVLIIVILTFINLGKSQISVDQYPIVRGESCNIQLVYPDTVLDISYRPNSSLVRTERITSAQPTSFFRWTPQAAGIVKISSTKNGQKNIPVNYPRTSLSGLIILIIAGTTLLAGIAYSMRVLLRTT